MAQDVAEPKAKTTKALAKVTKGEAELSTREFAEVAIKSGLYKDMKDVYSAIAKMSLGQSMGIDRATALQNILIVQGKMSFTSALIATRIKQSGKYRYEVLEKSDKKVTMQFYEKIEDWTPEGKQIFRWIKPGPPESFTIEMAKRAGLTKNQTWASYPEAMCFSRCLTAGARTYCPDVFCGTVCYSAEELAPEQVNVSVNSAGELVADVEIPDAEYRPSVSSRMADLLDLIERTKSPTEPILKHYQVGDLTKLDDRQLEDAISILTKKEAAKPKS